MSRRSTAMLSLLLVMGIWGSAFSVTKAATVEMPPVLIAFLRFALAAAILLPLALLRPRQSPPMAARYWITVAAMGLCGFTLFQAGSNIAQTYITATQAAIIQSIIPVLTAILAALVLRERLSGLRVAGIALSLVGVLVVVLVAAPSERAHDPLLGGAIMLAAVGMWAIYTVLAKRLSGADLLHVTAYSTAFGALFLLPLALLESGGRALPAISVLGWLSIAYLGILSSALASLLYNRSLAELEANQAATFINLVPIVGVAVAVLFLGEPLIGWQLVGGAVTLVGVWLAT
jgi:drug/metabolite transporter (DMT)-like permease